MGLRASSFNETMESSTKRRRSTALSLFAITLVVTSCDSFTSSSSLRFASASSSRRDPLKASHGASAILDPTTFGNPLASFVSEHDSRTSSRTWLKNRPAVIRKRKREKTREHHEERKQEWAATYTCVHCLRNTFGENQNKLWGDLDASTCRRLYKTLLPRALLELHRLGLHPEDLAPLAYKARVAAKLYARERCIVPHRYLAMGYDGFRQWKRYGKFQPHGMSYDQIWDKYEAEILEEVSHEELTEQDVTAKICLKILERSCKTNEGVDKLFLRDGDKKALEEQRQDIGNITLQLERDVRAILGPNEKTPTTLGAQRVFALKMVLRAKRRLEKLQNDSKQKSDLQMDVINPPWTDRSTHKMNNREKLWENRSN